MDPENWPRGFDMFQLTIARYKQIVIWRFNPMISTFHGG